MADSDLGDLYRLKGDTVQSLFFTRRAWATIAPVDALAFDKVNILNKVIEAERDAGNLDQALHLAETAIALTESSRATIIEQRDRIAYFGLLRSCYEIAVSCLLKTGDYATAFNYTERSRAREMSRQEPITFAEINLPDDLEIVSYYGVIGRLYAFVVNQNRITAVDLCSIQDVRDLFDSSGYPRNLVPGANGKLRSAFILDRLSAMIARPLDHLLSSKDRLCLIPFGDLNHVPIAIMFDAQRVFLSLSVTMLHYNNQRYSFDTIIAIGYNDGTLKHAEAEAESVGNVVCVGEHATRESLLNAKGASCLHISSHGYFDKANPTRSYIRLADGPIYADEIATQLHLDSSLVVLSSCNSGKSMIHAGEEPFGLIRAFMTAGAGAVLCSLWPVDEVATRLLMEYFYSNVRSGMRIAHALKAASDTVKAIPQSELRERLMIPGIPKGAYTEIVEMADDAQPFAHPYWWAGFVVIGGRLTQ
ncbi:MAG: CHAT domain-containing protein, partial [Caldilineaceae bacterium]|nr:CHAT domain-containing protein [Caldilineaceae bacterium]